jgi:hypothetical protein
MSHSCVCGGENENCRYCGGSGIVAERLGAALDDTLRRVTIENSPTEDIKAEHNRWPSWSQISVPPPIRWAKCPKGCGRWVNIQKVERHVKNCAGVRISPPQKKSPIPLANPKPEGISFARPSTTGTSSVHQNAAPSRRQRTVCPVCQVTVNVNRLGKHMAKVHKRRVAPSQSTSAKDPTRQNTTFVAPRDKNLDATKLYAHPCREQGRYGSHPSHDGFDDEAGPE